MTQRRCHSTADMFEEGKQYGHKKNVFRVGIGSGVDDASDGLAVLLK